MSGCNFFDSRIEKVEKIFKSKISGDLPESIRSWVVPIAEMCDFFHDDNINFIIEKVINGWDRENCSVEVVFENETKDLSKDSMRKILIATKGDEKWMKKRRT